MKTLLGKYKQFRRAAFRLAMLFAFVTSGLSSHSVAAAESEEMMRENLGGHVHFAWQRQEFDKLENWAKGFRTTNMRTPSGTYYLYYFYKGFSMAFLRYDADYTRAATESWANVKAKWVELYPESPTPHVAHAQIILDLAWKARGNGYINTVWKDGMAEFISKLKECHAYLIANEVVASRDPEYESIRASVEFLLTGDHDALIARLQMALKKYPTYLNYYLIGANYLVPKWGGRTFLVRCMGCSRVGAHCRNRRHGNVGAIILDDVGRSVRIRRH